MYWIDAGLQCCMSGCAPIFSRILVCFCHDMCHDTHRLVNYCRANTMNHLTKNTKYLLHNSNHSHIVFYIIIAKNMSVSPLIHLPMLPDNHTFSDDKMEFFYSPSGKLVIPPVFFTLVINRILKRLTKQVTDNGTSRLELTEEGNKWTDEAFVAYPFFDATQRDELNRPFAKYEKTNENKLKFAIHMQMYFGTAKQYGPFKDKIYSALQNEVVSRCVGNGGVMPNGDTPRTLQDVFTILKSDQMAELFQNNVSEVCNKLLYWIKSVTFEENIQWVEAAIDEYFQENGMLVTLTSRQTKTTRRHSLVRIAVEKGTQSTKEKLKELEEKVFRWVLKMDAKVEVDSPTYLQRVASDVWRVVRLSNSFVPKSRTKNPVYWLQRAGAVEKTPDIKVMMASVVSTAISSGVSFEELSAHLEDHYASSTSGSLTQSSPESMASNPDELTRGALSEGGNGDLLQQMDSLFDDHNRNDQSNGSESNLTNTSASNRHDSEASAAETEPTTTAATNLPCAPNEQGTNPPPAEEDPTTTTTHTSIPTPPADKESGIAPEDQSDSTECDIDPDSLQNSIGENEYLEMTKFDLWICKNAIITRRPVHEDLSTIELDLAKRSQCTYALCNPCYSKLALSCNAVDNSSRGRAPKRARVVDNDCNHSDLFQGLKKGDKNPIIIE